MCRVLVFKDLNLIQNAVYQPVKYVHPFVHPGFFDIVYSDNIFVTINKGKNRPPDSGFLLIN